VQITRRAADMVGDADPRDAAMLKSTDAEVRVLIQALGCADEAHREAALARLIIIGKRAVARLIATFESSPDRDIQLAILQILEATGDERALPVARRALAQGGDVAVSAVAILREVLAHGTGSTHAEALDALLALATGAATERRVRAAALQALHAAPADVRAAIGETVRDTASSADALWEDAAEGHLPDDPRALREVIVAHAEQAPLAVLRRLIESVREREATATKPPRRNDWQGLRGALHQAVALRGSRIALYDLRETIERATGPLPPSFLAAIQAVGDESCLEPLATAHARASDEQPRWRHQLEQAFHVVAKREHLTARHSAMRRALAKSPRLSTL